MIFTMKIQKFEIKYLSQLIITWTFINLSLNMLGLLITKLLNEAEYTYIDNITNEFIKPLAIQSLAFGVCVSIAFLVLKNKKIAQFAFILVQFVVFHIIFILNLKIHHGLHFQSTFNNNGLLYLSYCGQYLIDVLYLYFPINGNFDNGLFLPSNIGTFYLHWIFLNLAYYAGLTWISIKAAKYFLDSKFEFQS